MKIIMIMAPLLFMFCGRSIASSLCCDRSNDCPVSNTDYFNEYAESPCHGFHLRDGIQAQITFMSQKEVRACLSFVLFL